MRLDVSQQLRLAQQMKLSPRIIQAMEILQLPMMALQERIEAELQSNPVLEMQQGGLDPEAPARREEQPADRGEHDMVIDAEGGQGDDFERLADFEDEFGSESFASGTPAPSRQVGIELSDRKSEAMANTPAPPESLNEYLTRQWSFVETDEPTRRAGQLIIDQIDDDGYLRTPVASIAAGDDGVTAESLDAALRLVQTLEPVGVGARQLKECLLLQLAADAAAGKDVSLETELVEHFLRDIEMNRLPQIAKRTGEPIERIKAAIQNISHLDPRPGLLVGQRTVPVINPDVVVMVDDDGQMVVAMNDGELPHLRISRTYRKLARNRTTDKDARQFLRRNIRSAEWILSAIQQRRQTIRRVTEEIFKVQSDFLDKGPEALKPLPMADIAAKVGVHVATVSRAVAGKYVQTPRGIHPLRMFFSGGTRSSDGKDMSWDAVKVKLAELVEAEDKSRPLSDDELAARLESHGISIARRTVAKYRKLMGIPPARKRRQY